jgi:hypothetical protein
MSCFVQRRRGLRTWILELTIAGSGTGIVLGFFSRNAVRQACLARGWRFDDQIGRGPALGLAWLGSAWPGLAWLGSASWRCPVNWKLRLSRGGSAPASSSQILIWVTVGPEATCHFFRTGCISQCPASGSAIAVRAVSSSSTALTHAATASRAAWVTCLASSQSSWLPALRIASVTAG